MFRGAVLLVLQLVMVVSFPKYKDSIPNGHFVPDPCAGIKPGVEQIWGGVGHKNISGGGDLNPFGLAVKANNNTYNKALCQADSDNDGLTNGQELGDPQCVWAVGQKASYGPKGHPGICEPVGSDWCKSSWFQC